MRGTLPRVIAQSGTAYLIKTGDVDGRRYGRIYDATTDEFFEEMLVASIAARGYWDDPDSDRPDLIEKLSGRPS